MDLMLSESISRRARRRGSDLVESDMGIGLLVDGALLLSSNEGRILRSEALDMLCQFNL